MTFAEIKERRKRRIAEVFRLRDEEGLTRQEIAERLGVSFSLVRSDINDPDGVKQAARQARKRYKNGGTCEACGARTTNVIYTRCGRHRHAGGNEWRWTPERIVAAIQKWVLTYGRVPSQRDWTATGFKPNAERARIHRLLSTDRRKAGLPSLIPSASTVKRYFPTWGAAIRAAGYEWEIRKPEPTTHCNHGHELMDENLLVYADGRRRCRKCTARQRREHRQRQRAKKQGLLLGGESIPTNGHRVVFPDTPTDEKRKLARELRGRNWTWQQIGDEIGVSMQRAYQLYHGD